MSEEDEINPKVAEFRRLRQKAAETGFAQLVGSTAGRAWLWQLLETGGPLRSSFSTDPLLMAFNEGRQDAARQLLVELMNAHPDAYLKMIKEAKEPSE